MEPSVRREQIMSILKKATAPVSATALAKSFQVSRQIIVGDIALIRATGINITATPKGYVLHGGVFAEDRYTGKLASGHTAEETRKELYAIVDNGGEVIDVIVEHPIYGELSGQLNIASRHDADQFLEKIKHTQANLLSELTQGVHLHTIACKDKQTFDRIFQSLSKLGLLYHDK